VLKKLDDERCEFQIEARRGRRRTIRVEMDSLESSIASMGDTTFSRGRGTELAYSL